MTLDEYLVEYRRRQTVTRRLVALLEDDLLVAFKKRKRTEEDQAYYERQLTNYRTLGFVQKEVVEMLKDLKRQKAVQKVKQKTTTAEPLKERSCGPSDRR